MATLGEGGGPSREGEGHLLYRDCRFSAGAWEGRLKGRVDGGRGRAVYGPETKEEEEAPAPTDGV